MLHSDKITWNSQITWYKLIDKYSYPLSKYLENKIW